MNEITVTGKQNFNVIENIETKWRMLIGKGG